MIWRLWLKTSSRISNALGRFRPSIKGRRSVEILHHFNCPYCQQWWSVGDADPQQETWRCVKCGRDIAFRYQFDRMKLLKLAEIFKSDKRKISQPVYDKAYFDAIKKMDEED